jgi:YHS domain-containing protein
MAPLFHFMFRNVFRLLLILVAFAVVRYLIYVVKRGLASAPAASGGDAKSATAHGEHLQRDPVCGTFVPEHGTLTATSGGVTHHFCSVACRDKFLAA